MSVLAGVAKLARLCALGLSGELGPPSHFEKKVDAPLGAGASKVGVAAPARPARHAEDEDTLAAVHEGSGLGDGPFHQRLAGGHKLHDHRAPGDEVGSDRVDERRALHRVNKCLKKPCLLPSKADIAFLFRVESSFAMPVAFSASLMLWWMTLNARPYASVTGCSRMSTSIPS